MSRPEHQELRSTIQDMFPGVESPVTSSSAASGSGYAEGFASGNHDSDDDEPTPFPSPMMSATSLAGLSSMLINPQLPNLLFVGQHTDIAVSSNGELEEEVDMELSVSADAETKALEIKAQANKAFAGESITITPCTEGVFGRAAGSVKRCSWMEGCAVWRIYNIAPIACQP
jgi:serine/threonine-protein phosphatase 5